MTRIRFLTHDDIVAIHSASVEVLETTGVKIKNDEALELLKDAGCEIEFDNVKIPAALVEECLRCCPASFELYTREGNKSQHVGDDNVIFNPGSSVTSFRDHNTQEMRKGTTNDLVDIVRLVDGLDHLKAQSTALIPSDIPEVLSDFYRLFLVLKNSPKPIVTGAFRKEGFQDMKKLLEIVTGGPAQLETKPRAIFDCCPSSPLIWSDTTCQNLIDCATSGIPAEIVPAPLMGATSPVTITGTIIQTNAEILSGIVIAQLASPSAPIIYGGAPGTFDQRYATPRYGSVESIMAACAAAEVGKQYRLPTHAYLGLSDSKAIDAQTGFESALGIAFGAMSRINIISGPGALAYINMQSLEKLVIDNELCGAGYRLIGGLNVDGIEEIPDLIHKVGPGGDFLGQRHTASNFRTEHFMPTDLIDRLPTDTWIESGSKNINERARKRVKSLLNKHTPKPMSKEIENDLDQAFKELVAQYNLT
ncbi:MAG: trimethylamine methyltransferase family protein [Candidatus Thorarchaeota archaeon]|nr:trimethylamine methyltransferase family protein [Candidatus Thorarchaeota archaeon]